MYFDWQRLSDVSWLTTYYSLLQWSLLLSAWSVSWNSNSIVQLRSVISSRIFKAFLFFNIIVDYSTLFVMIASSTSEQLQELLNDLSMKSLTRMMSNFVDLVNFHVLYIVTVILCLSFATSTLFMRIYTKIYIIHKTEWADCETSSLAPIMNSRS